MIRQFKSWTHLFLGLLLAICFVQPVAAVEDNKVRVIIFSAPFGSGHDTAAKRIRDVITEDLKKQGKVPEVIVKNTLEFAPKQWTSIALKVFTDIQAKFPIVYTKMFEHYLAKALKVEHAGQMNLYRQLRIDTGALENYVAQGAFSENGIAQKPTLIFSTWPGSTEALIHLRHKNPNLLDIPLAHVQTDNAKDDKYFQLFAQDTKGQVGADVVYVPSKEVYDEYLRLGLSNVVFTGMPLRIENDTLPTYEERDLEKREAREKLGLDPNLKTVMIEAGKNGAANYAVIIASILHANPNQPMNMIAACGENTQARDMIESLIRGAKKGTPEFKKLYSEMKEIINPKTFKNMMKKGLSVFKLQPVMTQEQLIRLIEGGVPSNIRIMTRGFEQLEPLRSASDLVITKPGGLSTAELGANGRPMVILQEYASGEALPNGPLFEKKSLAIVNQNISEIGSQVVDVLNNEVQLREMYRASDAFRKQFYLEKVLDFVAVAEDKEKQSNGLVSSQSRSAPLNYEGKKSIMEAILCRSHLLR